MSLFSFWKRQLPKVDAPEIPTEDEKRDACFKANVARRRAEGTMCLTCLVSKQVSRCEIIEGQCRTCRFLKKIFPPNPERTAELAVH